MEYQEFAKYYDIFYQNKNYQKEVNFLLNFIKKSDCILDVGCGTGNHAELLQKYNRIDGIDLNKEMITIAKNKLNGNLYIQSILDININQKYDIIISMFAVINHLKDTKELEVALTNLKKHLNKDGSIIIDLHNPKSSGEKVDEFNNIVRKMEWDFNKKLKIENTFITFEINNKVYKDQHVFRIFTIDEVKEACERVGLKVLNVYENYDIKKLGNENSKNLQFVIKSI